MKLHSTFDPAPTSATQQLHVYNAMDCCLTLEVLEAILPQLDEMTEATYVFEKSLQGPVLEMQCRGVRIDVERRQVVAFALEKDVARLQENLDAILEEGLGVTDFNWASPQQLQELLYGTLGLSPVRMRGRITADRKALEKLRVNFYAEPIINHILALRDAKKKLGFLRSKIDGDGRIRTTFSIAGTDTGRMASYKSCFGSGTNLQNVTGRMREIFIADPGMKIAYVDLEQAESRAVGAILWNLFQDGRYLDGCESGDLHTLVTMLCWDDLPWLNAADPMSAMRDPVSAKHNKAVAKQPFYRHFDYRDAAKRLGHASNYFGQPPHISKEVHIPVELVTAFQGKYLPRFGLGDWHKWVDDKLRRDGWITTFMGRRRHFFGRLWDADTKRAAIAFEPQSAIADILNTGLRRVWKSERGQSRQVQLLLQVHDAIVFQYPEELEEAIVPEVMELLKVEVPLMHGRSLVIPTEAFTGWNWAYAYDADKKLINPDGLLPFGNDSRTRSKELSLMDRKFR